MYIADELAAVERPPGDREEEAERRPARVRQPQPRPHQMPRDGGAVDPGRHGQGLHQGLAVDERHAQDRGRPDGERGYILIGRRARDGAEDLVDEQRVARVVT